MKTRAGQIRKAVDAQYLQGADPIGAFAAVYSGKPHEQVSWGMRQRTMLEFVSWCIDNGKEPHLLLASEERRARAVRIQHRRGT